MWRPSAKRRGPRGGTQVAALEEEAARRDQAPADAQQPAGPTIQQVVDCVWAVVPTVGGIKAASDALLDDVAEQLEYHGEADDLLARPSPIR